MLPVDSLVMISVCRRGSRSAVSAIPDESCSLMEYLAEVCRNRFTATVMLYGNSYQVIIASFPEQSGFEAKAISFCLSNWKMMLKGGLDHNTNSHHFQVQNLLRRSQE